MYLVRSSHCCLMSSKLCFGGSPQRRGCVFITRSRPAAMVWCGACLFIIPSRADQAQAASADGRYPLVEAWTWPRSGGRAKRSRVHVKVGAREEAARDGRLPTPGARTPGLRSGHGYGSTYTLRGRNRWASIATQERPRIFFNSRHARA
jgi:hypothetical protein